MLRFLIYGITSLVVVAGTACGSGTSSPNRKDATVIIIVPPDADVTYAPLPYPDADYVPIAAPDAAIVDAWGHPILFPDCQGTPEQISACIINLPTPGGIPVNRPEPMDYNLCRP